MNRIDVGIGLAKSIIGRSKRPIAEFAKKYMVNGVNCSAVPVRDLITATLSTTVAPEFITKYDYSINDYLRLRGYGYKVRGSVTGNL
jgi:hypothetical protein